MNKAKTVLRFLLAALMVFVGVQHFRDPEPFVRIVPSMLPAPRTLVFVSGVFEILGGLGLLVPQTRRAAAWGLIALYVAVFPANINMAINNIPMGDQVVPPVFLWLRLPLQAVFIAWAWWFTRPDHVPGTAVGPSKPVGT
jgi:uncharacterized membrane protein